MKMFWIMLLAGIMYALGAAGLWLCFNYKLDCWQYYAGLSIATLFVATPCLKSWIKYFEKTFDTKPPHDNNRPQL